MTKEARTEVLLLTLTALSTCRVLAPEAAATAGVAARAAPKIRVITVPDATT